MNARHAWREAYRAARVACPAKGWVRGCFPRGWTTEDAARRLGRVGRLPASLRPVPSRVAIALDVAADRRRRGQAEAARMYVGFARRANRTPYFTPCPAFGA